ncbi:phosphatase PAP2 family protein [Lacticaseibacillus zhaodongensis]|uniref:phosphatase PAP2 family protein n=1 Tax=Lacticaseibacillus zhaodongensis TaxID=2668065 RepID=UPI0012D33548|nr:phosphatase PAP2 family protein [Lacticaseibacillus zhaodongensis]
MSQKVKFSIAGCCALIVLVLGFGVTNGAGFIPAIDHAGITLIVHRSAWLNPIVIGITSIGNPPVVAVLSICLALLFAWRRKPAVVGFIAANMIGVNLANYIIKHIVLRPRPFVQDPHVHNLVAAGGWSFPSGHSAGSVLFFGTIIVCAGLLAKRRSTQARLRVICVLFILAIGCSRIYVQVHFPTDVLAGYACGTCGLMLNWAFFSKALRKEEQQ